MQTITIPQGWESPRYSLGQRTAQGIILGMEYYPANTQLAYTYGNGWRYAVLPDQNSEEVRHYFGEQIQPLSADELQKELQAELQHYQQRVVAIQEQLAAMGGAAKTPE